MNPIRKFFGKLFNRKPEAVKVAPPKEEHFTIPAPLPKVEKRFSLLSWLRFRKREEKRKREAGTEKPTSFGTFQRMKPLAKGFVDGKPFGRKMVTPLNRQQKRDLSKLYGMKIK